MNFEDKYESYYCGGDELFSELKCSKIQGLINAMF